MNDSKTKTGIKSNVQDERPQGEYGRPIIRDGRPQELSRKPRCATCEVRNQGTRKGNAPTIHARRANVYSRGIPLAGALVSLAHHRAMIGRPAPAKFSAKLQEVSREKNENSYLMVGRMWGGAPCGRPSFLCGRLLIVAMLVCIAIVFVPFTAHAANGGNGRVYGQLLDGSKSNSPLAGQSVTLQMAQNGTAQDLKSARTDGQGNFSFTGLATDKSISYAIYLLYQGAQYNTKLIDLSTKAAQQDNLTVYDATTSTKKIAVLSDSILLQTPDAQKGIVTVSELYVFNNLDNHTYVGSLNASGGMPNALRFALPHTARNVSLSTGFDGYQSVQVNSGFASNAAVPPGISQFTFTFDMPYSESSYDFDYLVVYPTVQLSLYVPTDLHASSDTLASQGIVTANQRPYQLLRATTLSPGKEIHAQLEGLPVVLPNISTSSSSNANTLWLVAALIVMALIILLTWSIYRSRHRVAPAAKNNGKAQGQPDQTVTSTKKAKAAPVEKTEKEIAERQEQLLQALLDLDNAYEAGKLSKSVYQERRAKTKAKLRTLLASEPAHRKL